MADDLWQGDDGQTPLSESEQIDLIPSVVSRTQLNELELLNTQAARQWAMRRVVLKREDLLTDFFAHELHRRMFSKIWRWAGRYRTSDRNLGWEPHRIIEGVRNVFDDARHWIDVGTYPLPEAAVRLHHRLVLIHPWSNGNGRHARLIADVLMVSRGSTELPWGAPRAGLIKESAVRQHYIEALRKADSGDFRPLLDFCCG